MSETGDGTSYWWCLRHQRVEHDDQCPNDMRLGPYATEAEAANAIDRTKARSEAWEDEERRWRGED